MKTAFWQRYRMRFPPDIHPADATLSRVSRELTKRMLCVFNVGKVKTLQYRGRCYSQQLSVSEASHLSPPSSCRRVWPWHSRDSTPSPGSTVLHFPSSRIWSGALNSATPWRAVQPLTLQAAAPGRDRGMQRGSRLGLSPTAQPCHRSSRLAYLLMSTSSRRWSGGVDPCPLKAFQWWTTIWSLQPLSPVGRVRHCAL